MLGAMSSGLVRSVLRYLTESVLLKDVPRMASTIAFPQDIVKKSSEVSAVHVFDEFCEELTGFFS